MQRQEPPPVAWAWKHTAYCSKSFKALIGWRPAFYFGGHSVPFHAVEKMVRQLSSQSVFRLDCWRGARCFKREVGHAAAMRPQIPERQISSVRAWVRCVLYRSWKSSPTWAASQMCGLEVAPLNTHCNCPQWAWVSIGLRRPNSMISPRLTAAELGGPSTSCRRRRGAALEDANKPSRNPCRKAFFPLLTLGAFAEAHLTFRRAHTARTHQEAAVPGRKISRALPPSSQEIVNPQLARGLSTPNLTHHVAQGRTCGLHCTLHIQA